MDLSWLGTAGLGNIIVIGIIALFVILLIRTGYITFKGKGFNIGKVKDSERNIIRRQLEYVDAAVEEMLTEIPKQPTWNDWKSKYNAERVKDILQQAITFNHITTDRSYVLVKQLAIWSELQKSNLEDSYYRSDEFKQLIYRWVEDVIKCLLEIRVYNEKEDV